MGDGWRGKCKVLKRRPFVHKQKACFVFLFCMKVGGIPKLGGVGGGGHGFRNHPLEQPLMIRGDVNIHCVISAISRYILMRNIK